MNGIALYSVGANSMRILGPVLAGVIASIFGLEVVFLVSALLFVVVLVSIFLIGARAAKPRAEKTNPLEDLVEGIKYIGSHRTVLALILCAYVIAFLGTNYITLLPVFVRDIFKLGPEGLGFLTGATGTGAMVCAVVVAWMGNIPRKGFVLLLGCLVFGVSLIAFANSPFYLAGLILLFIVGSASALCLMLNQAILQTRVDQGVLGRVLSLYLIASGLQNIAGIPFGAVAQWIGAPLTITICGSIMAIFAVILIMTAPRLRSV
jgi:MFS transporter, DHA1 family, staphyloferrin A biosynthesis exporter